MSPRIFGHHTDTAIFIRVRFSAKSLKTLVSPDGLEPSTY